MRILSHRGYWIDRADRNAPVAFVRSFSLGFGTETDLRDRMGELVISHDPPQNRECSAANFLSLFSEAKQPNLPLAFNIKADGLQALVKAALETYAVNNYFLFDMSIPDTLVSLRHGLRCFSRQSEYEPEPALYRECAGVWMDCFHGEWMTDAQIARHLDQGKQVCLVSPELHGRVPEAFWERLAKSSVAASDQLMLCTDRPEAARKVIHGH